MSANPRVLSRLQDLSHVSGDGFFQIAGLGVQGFQFLAQRFELLAEVLVADLLARRDAYVAAGVEDQPCAAISSSVAALHRPGTSA